MPRKDKVIHISNLPSTFRGNITSNDELGPTFPFNIIQTTRSNGRNLPQNNMLLVVKYQM